MTETNDRPTRQRVTLTDISSRAWEHPADRGALVALRQLKGFDYVLRKMSGMINERAFRLHGLPATRPEPASARRNTRTSTLRSAGRPVVLR